MREKWEELPRFFCCCDTWWNDFFSLFKNRAIVGPRAVLCYIYTFKMKTTKWDQIKEEDTLNQKIIVKMTTVHIFCSHLHSTQHFSSVWNWSSFGEPDSSPLTRRRVGSRQPKIKFILSISLKFAFWINTNLGWSVPVLPPVPGSSWWGCSRPLCRQGRQSWSYFYIILKIGTHQIFQATS